MSMRHYRNIPSCSLIDSNSQFFFAEVNILGVITGGHECAGDQQFDPIATILDLVTHCLPHFLRTVYDETIHDHTLLFVAEEIYVSSPSGHRDPMSRSENTGTIKHAFVDSIPEIKMRIANIEITRNANGRPSSH